MHKKQRSYLCVHSSKSDPTNTVLAHSLLDGLYFRDFMYAHIYAAHIPLASFPGHPPPVFGCLQYAAYLHTASDQTDGCNGMGMWLCTTTPESTELV